MTKKIFRESVFIRVNGGQLTDSSSVDRRDIDAYGPAAINYVMMAGYNINIQGEANRDLSSLFYGYFPSLPVLKDITRHNWKYVTLPKGTVALPKNQGIRTVEDGCGDTYKPLSDNAFRTINHYSKLLNGTSYFRLDGQKIYLFSQSLLLETINISMVVNYESLDDNDILPIPAGLEEKAIQICYEYCTGQRQMPADRKSDERDIN